MKKEKDILKGIVFSENFAVVGLYFNIKRNLEIIEKMNTLGYELITMNWSECIFKKKK